MVDCKYFVILLLVIVNPIRCDFRHSIHKRVEELNNKSIEKYGKITKANITMNFDLEARLMYPRGDKHKLSELSQLWREYYSCTARSMDKMTKSRQYLAFMIMVYQGAVARFSCTGCVAPGEMENLVWMYSKHTNSTKYSRVEDHDRMVVEQSSMIVYNVMPEDAGIHWCQIEDSGGSLVVLEVVDTEEPYTVVKPPTSRGTLAMPPEEYHGLILFSMWSPWSECSVCGKVGRRHRHGMCYLKPSEILVLSILHYEKILNYTYGKASRNQFIDFDDKVMDLFKVFPDGIPCRSQYLPNSIKQLEVVQQRPSEIMIGLCKMPCKNTFEAKMPPNDTLYSIQPDETQMYSLTQVLPKQPPISARNTIFADFGQKIALRCPGTTLRDVPILWRIGTKQLVPRDVDMGSGGRVHINSRDHLVFARVLYRDANLYSCWQWGNLAGTVKLIVWDGPHPRWNHHVSLVMAVIVAGIMLRLAQRALTSIQRKQSILNSLK